MLEVSLVACCVWVLGCGDLSGAAAVRITHPQVADFVRNPAITTRCGQNSHDFWYGSFELARACISSKPREVDDFASDEPDEPPGDRLIVWLCDDVGGSKQMALSYWLDTSFGMLLACGHSSSTCYAAVSSTSVLRIPPTRLQI